MNRTWGDVEKEYMRAEELARRYGIEFVGNEYVAEEENEDDWVRLLDVIPVIAALEALNAELLEACKAFVATISPKCPNCGRKLGIGPDGLISWFDFKPP